MVEETWRPIEGGVWCEGNDTGREGETGVGREVEIVREGFEGGIN